MSQRLFLPVLLLGSLGMAYVESLDGRLQDIEQGETVSPARFEHLVQELALVRGELEEARARLVRDEEARRTADRLQGRLERLEMEVETARVELVRYSEDLEEFERRQSDNLDATLGTRLAHLDHDLDERWETVNRTLEATARLAEDSRASVHDLRRNIGREADRSEMWADLMGPTVQLADESTVGSGVLLRSVPGEKEGEWRTYLLTAWHVVRDILDDPQNLAQPIPVNVYRPQGQVEPRTAVMLECDVGLDVALLLMDSGEVFEHGARLPAPSRLSDVRTFDPVYAVGCPLGNDPIPTCGEIVDVRHEVDGNGYWMISAPTYIGNSGGGIFDAENRELLGIFSKIYTHGNLRPTVVPHMGLVTPLSVVYDWLNEVGFGDLIED